jgi:uncharacterized delta-60 repeat protein
MSSPRPLCRTRPHAPRVPVVRRLGVLIGGLLLVAFLGVPAGAEAHGVRASLRVRIDGVVGGAHTLVTVTGPGGFQRSLSRSQTLGSLRVGRYVLQAKPAVIARAVRGAPAGSELLPYATTIRVAVRRGKATTVKVRYATIIRKGVGALSAPPLQVLGSTQDPTGLVVGSSRAPRVGQILSEAPSTSLPGGLFDVVTAVGRRGAQDVISLRPATLSEAFPELSLNTTVALQPASKARASSVFGPSLAHAADLPAVDFSVSRGPFSCGIVSGSVAPRLQIALSLPLVGSPSAHVVLEGTGNVNLDLGTSAGMSCSYTLEAPPFQGWVPIGPVLVPVYGALQVVFSGSLSGPSIFNVGATLSAEGGIDYRNGKTTPVIAARASGHATAKLGCVAGTVSWLPTLEAGIGVKDPLATANVHVDLGLGPELNIASGGWGVDDLLQLTAGASLGPITATLPAVIQRHFATIATGPTTCGGSGGGGGGSTPPGSGGGGGGGGAGGGGGGGPGEPNPGSESSGLLDTGFGNGGQVHFAFPTIGNDTSAGSVAEQATGGTVIAGTMAGPNGVTRLYVTRLDGAGNIDSSFGSGGVAVVEESDENCFPYGGAGCQTAIESAANGIYVAGCFHTHLSLVRLRSNGSVDATFKNGLPAGLTCPLSRIQPLEVRLDPMGRVLVMASTEEFGEASGTILVRLAADGSLDATFGAGGIAHVPFPKLEAFETVQPGGFAVGRDGIITVGGAANHRNAESMCHYALAQLTESGKPDPMFGAAGVVVGPELSARCGALGLATRPDHGSELLLHLGVNLDGGPAYYAYGFTPRGEPNLAFGDEAGRENVTLAPLSYPVVITVSSDERTLIGGFEENIGPGNLLIGRLNATGRFDQTFGNGGISQTACSADYISSGSLAVAPDGGLIMAGTLGRQEGSLAPVSACVARWSASPK